MRAIWAPKGGPRWSQNGTQDGPKSKTKTKTKKDALEDRLGAVLGRSWLVLGVVLGSFLVVLYWFLYYFVTNEVFEKIRCQEATWADLGPIWVPKRVQNVPGGGSENELSWVELRCVKLSEVEVSLGVEKGG